MRKFLLAENAANFGHIEPNEQAEDGFLNRGGDDLADDGKVEG